MGNNYAKHAQTVDATQNKIDEWKSVDAQTVSDVCAMRKPSNAYLGAKSYHEALTSMEAAYQPLHCRATAVVGIFKTTRDRAAFCAKVSKSNLGQIIPKDLKAKLDEVAGS